MGQQQVEQPVSLGRAASGQSGTELARQTIARLGAPAINPGPLIELLNADARDPEAVIAALERSPVLAARVLAVANSAAFGVSQSIKSIDRAVRHLGPSRTRALALAYGTKLIIEMASLPRPVTDNLWVNSLHKACAAKLCCLVLDPRQAETAYSVGLIQDLGLPMLMAVDQAFYEHHLLSGAPGDSSWLELERKQFGLTHCGVGQGLLLQWSSAAVLQQAVLHHHRAPTDAADDQVTPDTTSIALELSNFVASLLPHLHEPMHPRHIEWFNAVHSRFLSLAYASPDAFLHAVGKEARQFYGPTDEGDPLSDTPLMRRLIREVAGETVSTVTRLTRMETALDRQREDLNDLRFQAFTDPLTKVLNRGGFTQLSQRRLDSAGERGLPVTCILLDMDRFKPINDEHGHDAGDMLLRGLAKLMRRTVDRNDLIGRLGGDEFAIFLLGPDRQQAEQIAKRLITASQGTVIRVKPQVDVLIRFSLGAVFQQRVQSDVTVEQFLAAADQAMYASKRRGKGMYTFIELPDSFGAGAGDRSMAG